MRMCTQVCAREGLCVCIDCALMKSKDNLVYTHTHTHTQHYRQVSITDTYIGGGQTQPKGEKPVQWRTQLGEAKREHHL